MDPNEWFSSYFEPRLARGDATSVLEANAALHALALFDVLPRREFQDAAQRAKERFEQIGRYSGAAARRAVTPHTAEIPLSAPRVFAVGRVLADVDAVPIALLAVELWPESVVVHVAAIPARRAAAPPPSDAPAPGPASDGGRRPAIAPPRDPIIHLPLTVTDDAGSTYRAVAKGSSAGVRGYWQFRPCPPFGATRLVVSLQAQDGTAYSETIAVRG